MRERNNLIYLIQLLFSVMCGYNVGGSHYVVAFMCALTVFLLEAYVLLEGGK